IGTNSAGSRSIAYGKTSDHVLGLGVVLADGRSAEFGMLSRQEWERRAEGRTPDAPLLRQVREAVLPRRDEIRQRFPRILRRVSGYNLDLICNGLADDAHLSRVPDPWPLPPGQCGLHQLILGSEGTLA